MLYIEENQKIEVFLSIGEIIEYELENGEIIEGIVLEIDETFDSLKVLPILEDSLIIVPTWISVDDIVIEEV
jgi:hypothetical protein